MAETSTSTSNSSMIEHLNSERRSKLTMKESNFVRADLISRLPDEVLTHILSYIPTKSSVATSVLSKRWNHLWISVPNLDFDGTYDGFFPRPKKLATFVNFVDRVLSLNNVLSVRKICLLYDRVLEVSRFDAWISSIAKRNAEKLYLWLCSKQMYRLPDSFFNQKHLVELKLLLNAKIPQLVCFPNLRTIHLDYRRLLDDDSIKNLLSGCPDLMNLSLRIYEWDNALTLYICSSTLRNLHLQTLNLHPGRSDEATDPLNVVINAPNVRDLHLVDHFGSRYNKIDVSSFVKLYLCFDSCAEMSFELLTNLTMFHNLTHLTLVIIDMEKWESVPRLLQRTSNLVTFILHTINIRCWNDPNVVPNCLLSCLETVEISILFSNDIREEMMMMISYILKYANILKKLSIYTSYATKRDQIEFRKTLLNLPRSSVACQVYYKDKWMDQQNDEKQGS